MASFFYSFPSFFTFSNVWLLTQRHIIVFIVVLLSRNLENITYFNNLSIDTFRYSIYTVIICKKKKKKVISAFPVISQMVGSNDLISHDQKPVFFLCLWKALVIKGLGLWDTKLRLLTFLILEENQGSTIPWEWSIYFSHSFPCICQWIQPQNFSGLYNKQFYFKFTL